MLINVVFYRVKTIPTLNCKMNIFHTNYFLLYKILESNTILYSWRNEVVNSLPIHITKIIRKYSEKQYFNLK